jgi:hypothetical protein
MSDDRYDNQPQGQLVQLVAITVLVMLGVLLLALPALQNTRRATASTETLNVEATVSNRLTAIAGQATLNQQATAIIAEAVGVAITQTAQAGQTQTASWGQTRIAQVGSATIPPTATTVRASVTPLPTIDTKTQTQIAVTLTQVAQATEDMARAMAVAAAPKISLANSPRLAALSRMGQNGPAVLLASSRDERRLASAGEKLITLWDVLSGQQVAVLTHDANVTALAFSPDNKILISTSESGAVWFWNADTGQPIQAHKAHSDAIFSLALSPDGLLMVTAGRDNTVLWDLVGQKPLRILESGWAWRAEFSANGRFVITAGANGDVRLWGVKP